MAKERTFHIQYITKWAKNYYQQILVAALVIITVLIIYGNDFSIILNEALNNDYYNYVLLLPFFFAFLIYLKRDAIKATLLPQASSLKYSKYVSAISGLILCLVAFLLYWYGTYTLYAIDYHIISLPIFLAGVTLFLANYQTLKILILPLLFLLFLIIPPTTVLYSAAGTLANFNTQISYTLLRTLNLPVTLTDAFGSPTILLTSATGQSTSFTVDIACSGIYSLVAYLTFAAFLAFIFKTTIIKKLAIFAFGIIAFTLLNPLRITTIVLSGYLAGQATAQTVHTISGIILIFIGMILTLIFSDKILKAQLTTAPKKQQPCDKCTSKTSTKNGFCKYCGRFIHNKKASISKNTLAKLLVLLLLCSVAALTVQAPSFVTAQNTLEVNSTNNQQNSINVLPQIQGFNLSFLYRDTAYEKVADQLASLMYAYFPTNGSDLPFFYVDIGVANSLNNLHNWEVCLISYETSQGQTPIVNVLDTRDIQLLQNPPLTAEFLTFKNPSSNNSTQITLYWYERAPYKTGLTVQLEYVRISLIILTQNSTNYSQIEDYLQTVALPIANAWEPLKDQSIISLGIPTEQILLALSIALLIILATAQSLIQKQKDKNNQKIFNLYATKKEQITLNTIQKLTKEKKYLKTNEIIEAIQQRTGKTVNPKVVFKILQTLQNNGFIKQTIIIDEETPIMRWKM